MFVSLLTPFSLDQFVTKSLVGESYLVYGLESQRNRHVPPREELERKWHGDESRASSMDNLV